ncbi:MAG TPA: DUF3515 domain-containing protein [Pseudonocardiaceae bacterium]|nr:DUF3515 domain-containing protein [Pseudonocardiaceae bacterium]
MESATKTIDTESEPQPPKRGLSPSLVVAAGLGVALLVGAVVTGIVLNGSDSAPSDSASTGPVALVPVDSPQANSAGCAKLIDGLPRQLPDNGSTVTRRALAKPAPAASAAWGAGDSPVVLRCGVEQPPEFVATSQLLQVNQVRWLQVTGDGAATWYAVDRPAIVALTVPSGSGTGPLQEISTAVAAAMPAVPIHPAGG